MSASEVTSNLRHPVRVAGEPEPVMILTERMAHYRVPGVSLALIENGHIAWAEGYGVKIAGEHEPVTPNTRFQAASISKPVGAACDLRLVELGRLELDEDVNVKLTSWQVPEHKLADSEKVTLRRILNHSAGLTVHGFSGYAASEKVPKTIQVLNGEALANSEAVGINLVPGTVERYSGGGYTILQLLIEDVTGLSFDEAVQKYVLEPAGMAESTYAQPLPETLEPHAATAHDLEGKPVSGRWHTYPEKAAAGLWTTPTDLARFALSLQASLRGAKGALLRTETIEEMLTPQLGAFGLGLVVQQFAGKTWFSHGGSNEGYRCALLASASTGQGIVIMSNGENGLPLVQEVLTGTSHVFGWQAAEQVVRQRAALNLAAYEGRYTPSGWSKSIELEASGDVLNVSLPWQAQQTLIPESTTRFFFLEDTQDVLFTLNPQGEIEALAYGGISAKKEGVI